VQGSHKAAFSWVDCLPLRSALVIQHLSDMPVLRSIMIDWSTCLAVERDDERVSGAWVFRGSRVPIAALFENLEDDASVHQFVEWFPGVTIHQARQVLEHAARSSLAVA
jgi:uncharacterized protein (DUF433 family)